MRSWNGKRVTVTGGYGFVGSHLVKALELAGAEVFDSPSYDLRTVMDVELMLSDAGPIDILFHLAAVVGGIGANQVKPADFYADNVLMNTLIVREARNAGVKKFVGIGSVCAYPANLPYPFREENLFAGYPEETNAPYGIAKRGHLVHIQAMREQYGFPGIFIIPTNLYGPGDNFDLESSHVIPALIRKIVEAKEADLPAVEVWGTGNATRDFLYVTDCVRALMLAAVDYDDPDPMNLGTAQPIAIAGLVNIIKQIVGYDGTTIWDVTKPDGQRMRSVDFSKAQHTLGWVPEINLREGLEKTISWYMEERNATD